jgi:hypothetical protein
MAVYLKQIRGFGGGGAGGSGVKPPPAWGGGGEGTVKTGSLLSC